MLPTQVLIRMPLARQIFLVEGFVLGAAALALILGPVSVSVPIAGSEAGAVLVGLALVLGTIHLSLRRLLAPMHRLADAMGTVDPRHPSPELRRHVAPDDRDVARLLDAFEQMLDRFRSERLESDRRTVAAQDAERRRVASEIHDELGQTLTALALQIERADLESEARERLRRIVARALDDVRGISRRLRPEALDDLGLVNALIALTSRVSDESDLPVTRNLAAPLPPLEPDAELAIYRIAQEALTNVIRHSDARRAAVTVQVLASRVVLSVEDDGRGFVLAPPSDGGISGMHDRARLAKGELEVWSDTMRGTTVRFSVPVAEAPDGDDGGERAARDSAVAERAAV